ncbi:unnamed protein product [Gongylonema pulchrum]|uniref:Secreted protein n=1 Tax=Gongylonema pulchrum TaxID=637853 RepID=A0A183CUT0_9BILA|nr:unnamed protein product [Gongylonema pulchrum]
MILLVLLLVLMLVLELVLLLLCSVVLLEGRNVVVAVAEDVFGLNDSLFIRPSGKSHCTCSWCKSLSVGPGEDVSITAEREETGCKLEMAVVALAVLAAFGRITVLVVGCDLDACDVGDKLVMNTSTVRDLPFSAF